MFEPVRGGTRGGQAEFKWSDVSADKDREHYLGHSINAPTGRWQKNKDVHWYNRETKRVESERNEEIRKIKELEAEALSAALGFETKKTVPMSGTAPTTNGTSALPNVITQGGPALSEPSIEKKLRRKAERKEEKRMRKEEKRATKEARRIRREMEKFHARNDRVSDREPSRRRHRRSSNSGSQSSSWSRSRSPRRRSYSPLRTYIDIDEGGSRRYGYDRPRSRSRTPERRYSDQGHWDHRRRDYR